MNQEKWSGERLESLYMRLQTTTAGLSHHEARARISSYGYNELKFHRTRSLSMMLLDEFRALFPVLLMISSAMSFVANFLSPGEGYGLIGVALLGVVILNALVSFYQNYKVEKLMMAFLDYIPKSVNVLRDEKMETFVEVGPGRVLAGLLKKILPPDYSAKIYNISNMKQLEKFMNENT